MKRVCILGSTGSVGTQALEVCEALGYEVTGLAVHGNVEQLFRQVCQFHPKMVCIFDEAKYGEWKALCGNMNIETVVGLEGLCALAAMEDCDIVLNAVVGMIGLEPTLAAIHAGHDVALANKETLVTGGKLVMEAAAKFGVRILPVDSEHSAIFQSLQGNRPEQVRKVILTASGGPFYGRTRNDLEQVTLEQALNHPNWSMGAKITIDSATMMNKGLEVIEAGWLFDKTPEEIDIVVHRESVIHSLVEYEDGAVIAQLGAPDMRLPIQYALTYPERLPCPGRPLSLTDYGTLSFGLPDEDTFLCLCACREAMRRGGLYPAIVNGANECAVSLFLRDEISFLEIGDLVEASLSLRYDLDDYGVDDINAADLLAREFIIARVN